MKSLKVTIEDCPQGISVKEYAKRVLGISSRALVLQKQRSGGILRNGIPCRVTDFLQNGDELTFRFPQEQITYPEVEGEVHVLWETQDFLAVDKPPFMPVHPSPGHDRDSLLNVISGYFRKTGQDCLFRPMYRLDKDTSGILLLGKHRIAASSSCVEKTYYGVCEGELKGEGTVSLPIGLKEGSKIQRDWGQGSPAVTHWKSLAKNGKYTLAAFHLETGRTHQIRVHMASLGHPLAGDELYGGTKQVISRQALHCGKLSLFYRPLSLHHCILADFPEDMKTAFPWLPALETK